MFSPFLLSLLWVVLESNPGLCACSGKCAITERCLQTSRSFILTVSAKSLLPCDVTPVPGARRIWLTHHVMLLCVCCFRHTLQTTRPFTFLSRSLAWECPETWEKRQIQRPFRWWTELRVLAKGQEDYNRKVERLGQRKEDHETCMCIQES